MARTTPVNAGYEIISGTGTGSNGARTDVWLEYKVLSQDMLAKGEHPRLETMMEKMAPELLRAARSMEMLRRRLGPVGPAAPEISGC